MQLKKNDKLLDVGCGLGGLTVYLIKVRFDYVV